LVAGNSHLSMFKRISGLNPDSTDGSQEIISFHTLETDWNDWSIVLESLRFFVLILVDHDFSASIFNPGFNVSIV